MITDFDRFDEFFVAEWVIGNGHCLKLSDLPGTDEKLSANAEGDEGRGGNQASGGSRNSPGPSDNPPPHGHEPVDHSVFNLLHAANVHSDNLGQILAFTVFDLAGRRFL